MACRNLLFALLVLTACDAPTTDVDASGIDAGDDPRPPCERDADCADERFCNGAERCVPGDEAADARGCVAGGDPCGGEACDEAAGACVGAGCESPDIDGDGDARPECGGGDCDDTNARRHSGALERCDPGGIDEDCQPATIQAADGSDGDQDGDGFISATCSNPREDGGAVAGDDCDDRSPSVFPGAIENCNFVDDDCDGRVDEGVLSTYYLDADGDGFGDGDRPTTSCVVPQGHVLTSNDCNDADPDVNPGETEECNGFDDDCDGETDPGCSCTDGETTPCGTDRGNCRRGLQTCVGGVLGGCEGGVTPSTEVCSGGSTDPEDDEDCDGEVDEVSAVGRRSFFVDVDGDGYGGATSEVRCPAADGSAPPGFSETNDDCVDNTRSLSADIHPGAAPQAVAYCDGSPSNCSTVRGEQGCSGGGMFCLTEASFDYDCDGAETPQARHSCTCSGFPCSCGGRSGPSATHTDPEECGTPVSFSRCCPGTCSVCSTTTSGLRCR